MIRNPYIHNTWREILFRERFVLAGIRSGYSQKQIKSMSVGDLAIFYDKQSKEFKGILEVHDPPKRDYTASESDLFCVEFSLHSVFSNPIHIDHLKTSPVFTSCLFFRQRRFSVAEVSFECYQDIVEKDINNQIGTRA